jgi:manganese/iron transport system ATP-binding protein
MIIVPAHFAMLEVQHLSVNYRGIRALEDVSLSLLPGELVGLIGPNGAGKSNFIRAVLGLIPGAGQVRFQGQPLHRQRQQIAYVPQRWSTGPAFGHRKSIGTIPSRRGAW